jgi:sec-independent protein translocase protein TatB
MFDIGFLELVLVGIIGLIILGPERLPIAARTLGRWIGRARRMVTQFTQEIDKQMEIEELKAQLKKSGESLDINQDVKQIQETVSQALKEAEHQAEEFEPLPRKEPDQAFSTTNKVHTGPSQAPNIPPALDSKNQ